MFHSSSQVPAIWRMPPNAVVPSNTCPSLPEAIGSGQFDGRSPLLLNFNFLALIIYVMLLQQVIKKIPFDKSRQISQAITDFSLSLNASIPCLHRARPQKAVFVDGLYVRDYFHEKKFIVL
jgi:hypothetical protein